MKKIGFSFPLPFHLFLNLRLKYKLLLSYFFLITLPLGILTIISYHKVSQEMESKFIFSATQAFQQADSFLSYSLLNVITISDALALDKKTNEILRKNVETYSIPHQIEDAGYISSTFRNFEMREDIFKIRLYINDKMMHAKEHVDLFGFEDAKKHQWYKKLEKTDSNIIWFPSSSYEEAEPNNQKTISIVRFVRNENSLRENIGILRIDILESRINEIIQKANISQNGAAFLINSDNLIVTASSDNLPRNWGSDIVLKNVSLSNEVKYNKITIDDRKFLVCAKKVERTDWTLVSVIPVDEILSVGIIIRNMMFFLMTLLGTAAFIAAFFIAYTITKRIDLLNKTIRKVQDGNFTVRLASNHTDEIGDLIRNFNFMTDQIRTLIKEQYRIGQEAKAAELRVLQAQINPHFLYNTLDMISWIAKRHKISEISYIVEDLANFYKLSLNKGKDIVSIYDEISHIEYYLKIQNKRYENRIRLELNIDEDVFQCCIPKIILQPLVENAIQHGILPKKSKSGTISISGQLKNDYLLLVVCDDGVGMPAEMLERIFKIKKSASNGYGVQNINERLKLYYGPNFGLSYQSTAGSGTSVEITLPAIKYNENT